MLNVDASDIPDRNCCSESWMAKLSERQKILFGTRRILRTEQRRNFRNSNQIIVIENDILRSYLIKTNIFLPLCDVTTLAKITNWVT